MKNASNFGAKSHTGWRVVAFALLFATVLYFLPILPTHGQRLPAAATVTGELAAGPRLPFGLTLLSYAKAASTTLELSKTGPAETFPGGTISYQLSLTNSGAISAEKVLVTDFFPTATNTPVLGLPPTGWGILPSGPNPDSVGWFSADFFPGGNPMPPTSTVKFSFQINVNSPLPNGAVLTNTYTVTSTNADVVLLPGYFTTTVRAPEFGPLNKTVSPTTVTPGNLLTYTLTLANVGAYTATNVIITDTIPAHTTYFDSTPPASAPNPAAGSVITWTIAQLDAGATATVTLRVQTDPVITNGVAIVNSNYRASSSGVFTPAVGAPVTATVASAPALTITKTATATSVEAGAYLGYVITVTNQSSATDYGRSLQIVDLLPPQTLFVSAGISGGAAAIDAPTPGSTGAITWTITSPAGLDAGESLVLTATVRAQSPYTNNTVITNTAVLTAANIPAEISSPPLTTTITSSPQITLTKIVQPAAVLAGQPLTYTVVITNSGNETAYNIPLTDTLPAGFSPAVVNRTETITGVGLLQEPVVVTFTISATAGSVGGQFPNLITTTVNGIDIASGPVATVTVIPQVFTVTKTASPEPVVPGSVLTYTIVVTNETTSTETAIITDTYPAEVQFSSASPAPTTGNNVWQISVGPLASRTIVVSVTVNSPLTNSLVFTNRVDVDNLVSSPRVSATAASTVVSTPTLHIRKVASLSPAQAGQPLTYTIYYSNTGTAIATGLRLTDTLPASVTVSSVTPTPAISVPGQLVWTPAPLSPADGEQSLTVYVTVTQPMVSGTLLVNQVDIGATNAASATATLNTPVNSLPLLQISKTASSDPIAVGQVLTYTLTFTNSGTADATNVFITDTLDSNVIYQGNPGGQVSWNIPQAPADGLPHSVSVTVTVAATLPNNSVLTNQYQIASDETGLAASGSITTLVQAPQLAVTKVVSPAGFVRAGEAVEYTITYSNTGPITASNVLITDTYPLSVTNIVSASTDAVFDSSPSPNTLVWLDAVLPPASGGSITLSGNAVTSPWPATGLNITNTVLVESGSLSATDDAVLEGRPGLPAGSITVIPVPSSQTVGQNIAVMTSVADAYGNPVYDGTAITFTTSLSGSNYSNAVVNTSNGMATGVLSSTVAGTSMAAAEATSIVSGSAVVTFTADAAVRLVLQATSPQTAGVTFPISITAVDQFGNRDTGFNQSVSLADTTGTLTGGPVTLSNGFAVVSNVAVLSATTPASTIITGTGGGITGTVAVEIVPNLANLQLALAVDSPIRVCESGTFTATLTDNLGNPIAGETITFSYPATKFSPMPDQNRTTSSSGVATLTVTRIGSSVSADLVSAFRGTSPIANQFVSSLPADPASTAITVTVSPASIPANGSATTLLSAQVGNCAGPVADGTVVTFTLSPALDLSPTPPFTAATSGGAASATLTAGVLTGTVTITGQTSGKTDTASLTLTTPGAAVLAITKSATPAGGNVLPGSTINYTVSVQNVGTLTATNVVITDDLDAVVQFVTGSNSSSGSFNHSSGRVTVQAPSLAVGGWLTATWSVTVTNVASGTTIQNTANANSDTTGLITSTTVTHQVITQTTSPATIYLPIIIKGCCLPNLVIDSFTVDTAFNPPHVTVVVRNNGQEAISKGFWLDVYVNPTVEPKNLISGPNPGDRRWERIRTIDRGIAWPISTALQPGDTLTRVLTTPLTVPNETNWVAFPAGSYTFYTFADSYDSDDNYFVEIFESDEMDNQAQTGPLSITGGLEIAGDNAAPSPAGPRHDLSR